MAAYDGPAADHVSTSVSPGTRVLTSDGVDVGRVEGVIAGETPGPCVVLSIDRADRDDGAAVIVPAGEVVLDAGTVRLRHVTLAQLGTTGWARAATAAHERPPSGLDGERPATAPVPCMPAERERTT
jgi:hypothetical protein